MGKHSYDFNATPARPVVRYADFGSFIGELWVRDDGTDNMETIALFVVPGNFPILERNKKKGSKNANS